MEDAEMDKGFYDKLEASRFRPFELFDVAAFEESCKKAEKERKDKELSALRDHFAGLAMQGFISRNELYREAIVETAYEYADAMLKQRSLTNA